MGKTKNFMRELSKDKDTRKQKFAVFQNRIEKKKGYLKALNLLDESMRLIQTSVIPLKGHGFG